MKRTSGTSSRVANVIMEDFAKRLAAEFSGQGGGTGSTPTSISAHKVVWQAIKSKLS